MRVPLNPCDYHFYILQRDALRGDVCRFNAYMGFDVDGVIDERPLVAHFQDAIRRAPALGGALRFSPLLARPYWAIEAAPVSAQKAYHVEDLTAAADWPAAADAALARAASQRRVLGDPPLLHVHHLKGPSQTRVFLTWPHMLMDAQGAYEVLRILSGAAGGRENSCGAFAGQPPPRIDPLRGESLPRRIGRVIAGLRVQRATSRIQTSPPPIGVIEPDNRVGVIRRMGTADDLQRVIAAAKRLCPPGPALYARHLAACTLRALARLYAKCGWSSPAFAVSFPMRPSRVPSDRPVTGNDLVSVMLHAAPDVVADWSRLGQAIAEQIRAFQSGEQDLNQWAVLWASAQMRPGQYHWVMKSAVAKTPIISGYSYFHADDAVPLRTFSGGPIRSAFCGGVVATPPGWNPVFWRHADCLSMTLAWPRGHIDDELSIRYADLIVAEAMDPS